MPRQSLSIEKANPTSRAPPRGSSRRKKHEGVRDQKWKEELEGVVVSKRSEFLTNCHRQKMSPLLMLPDDVIRLIILHILDTPENPGVLAHRSLESLEYVLWFALAHPDLMHVLRSAVHTLIITQNDSITVFELSVISRALRSLSILGHSLAARYLDNIVSFSCPALRSLTLENVTVPRDSFVRLVQNSKLFSLALSFVTLCDLSTVVAMIAPALSELHALHLSGLSSLDGSSLMKICTSAQRTLRKLSLRYLRHISLTSIFFRKLRTTLRSLIELCIEDVRYTTAAGIATFVIQYADSLEGLELRDVPICADLIYILVSHMPFLQHLAVQYPMASTVFPNPDVLVRAYILNAQSLHIVDLHGVSTLRDRHVSTLVSALQRLSSLTLRRCPGITDAAAIAIASAHSKFLRTIDLRGSHLTDVGLTALGLCNELQNIFLGGEDEPVPYRESHSFNPHGITNEGMDALLCGCGKSLRSFFWQSPRTIVSEDGTTRVYPLGVESLDGKALAQSLGKFCPSIVRVEVNWLRPHSHLRELRAEHDLAFFDLDQMVPSASVYLDREPL